MSEAAGNVQVNFTAAIGSLQSSMKQAVAEVNQTTQKISSSMQTMHSQTSASIGNLAQGVQTGFSQIGSSIASLGKSFISLGAVLAAGAFFKSAMASSLEFTDQVDELAKALGMSTEKATTLNIALREIGTSADEYIGMIQKLDRQLRTNSDLFDMLGVKTKDSSGKLLDQQTIMQNALSVMLSFASGTDRNIVAQAFFGRNAQAAAELIRLNAEAIEHARQVQEELNLTVGEDGVVQMHKHQQAMADIKMMFTAIGNEVVASLLPAIKDLTKFLLDNSEVIKLVGIAISSAVLNLRIMVNAIQQVIIVVKTMGLMLNDVFNRDFNGAIDHAKIGFMELKKNGYEALTDILKYARTTNQALSELAGGKKSTGGKESGTEGGKGKLSTGQMDALSGKGGGDRLSVWEEEYKATYLNLLRAGKEYTEKSAAEELKFWQEKLLLTKKGSQERLAVQKKITDLEIQIYKEANDKKIKMAKTEEEVNLLKLDSERAQAESMMALKKEELQTQATLGLISKQEEIESLKRFEAQAYQMELKAYEDKLELLKDEPVKYQEMLNKIQALKAKHDLEMKKLDNKAKLNTQQTWKQMLQPVKNAINTSIQGMIQGTQTLRQAMAHLCQSILASFVGMLVEMAMQWIEKHIMMAIFGQATNVAAGESAIATSAAVGAAAAGSSVAFIPYVGWAMVPEVMAETYGELMAMMPLAAASGGFDVPEDITTRLHAKEMVLPADIAEGVRNMARGGGGDTGKTTTFKFKGLKPNQLYKGSDLVSALKILTRDNHLKAGAYR